MATDSGFGAVTGDPGEHLRLAAAAARAGDNHGAQQHLLEAVRLAPGRADAQYLLGAWFYRHGEPHRGVEHTAAAVSLQPGNVDFVVGHATAVLSLGDKAEAWRVIEPLVASSAGRAPVAKDRWLANLYERVAPSLGHEERALAYVARALCAPGLPPGPDGKAMLHFSAAALLDRLGRYDEAFEQARLGNAALRAATKAHDPEGFSRWVDAIIGFFTPERLAELPRPSRGSGRPVFVVGMPRSGTSLVEEILGSHPQVFAAGELQALRLTARAAATTDWSGGKPFPECLDALTPERVDDLASQYLQAIGALNAEATYVTDKQPLNFLLVGLAQVLFPTCHVVHCVRDPLDTCLSCYMNNFEQANAFKFDLSHLGSYYRDYRRLTAHWRDVLSVPLLEVRYEELVADVEGHVRRLLAFLDLPWDDRCLRYYENRRVVKTASRDQVRRPVYASSVGRWKRYERHLGELVQALGHQ